MLRAVLKTRRCCARVLKTIPVSESLTVTLLVATFTLQSFGERLLGLVSLQAARGVTQRTKITYKSDLPIFRVAAFSIEVGDDLEDSDRQRSNERH